MSQEDELERRTRQIEITGELESGNLDALRLEIQRLAAQHGVQIAGLHLVDRLTEGGPTKSAERHWHTRPSFAPRVLEMLRQAGFDLRGRSLLDVGCAQGRDVHEFDQMGVRAQGLEIDADDIRIARERYPGLRFTLGSIYDLPHPFGGGAFDAVVCVNTLSHVDAARALPGLRAVLTATGVGFITLDGSIEDLEANTMVYSLDVDRALASLAPVTILSKTYGEREDASPFRHRHSYYEVVFRVC